MAEISRSVAEITKERLVRADHRNSEITHSLSDTTCIPGRLNKNGSSMAKLSLTLEMAPHIPPPPLSPVREQVSLQAEVLLPVTPSLCSPGLPRTRV